MPPQSTSTKRLDLSAKLIAGARAAAAGIVREVQNYIDAHTTIATERAVIRLLGVDGVNANEWPLPNVVAENIQLAGGLGRGAAYWLANACVYLGQSPQEVAEGVARGSIDLAKVPPRDEGEVRRVAFSLARETTARILANRRRREEALARFPERPRPLLYVIVATGDIHADVIQAQAAVRQGADIVAVIRSTGQSLLDYVPFGPARGGFGGTYATQANFAIMRRGLDAIADETGKYPFQVNYCSGLCMPEMAAMGALERLDMMLNDAMYGILFRDINMRRTFVDQFFSRVINGYAGVIINTGEDNYTTTDDPVTAAHTVLASQFINERFAKNAGLPDAQIGLGHAFQIAPDLEDGLLLEIAQAEMTRQIFPHAPLKYMPPTRHMPGNIFRGHVMGAMFDLVGAITGQEIQLLGVLTEAVHTPFMQDRFLALDAARYVRGTARHLREELLFRKGGVIERRAQEVLREAAVLLKEIEKTGLMAALERGVFAGVRRRRDGGKGAEGVVAREPGYYNPFLEIMLPKGGGRP
jgi:beta-lysine 5,6-aminomutase alpha subunit